MLQICLYEASLFIRMELSYALHCEKHFRVLIIIIIEIKWQIIELGIMSAGEYDISRTCRSCLWEGDKMISLDKPYNANSECTNSCETIGKLMMTCANVQVHTYFQKHSIGYHHQQVIIPFPFFRSHSMMGCRQIYA